MANYAAGAQSMGAADQGSQRQAMQLLRTARARAHRLCRSFRVPTLDPDDVTQDLAVAILARLNRYNSHRASLPTFIEAIATNQAISLVRRWRAAKRSATTLPLTEHPYPAYPTDLRFDIQRIIARVNDQDRRLAVLLMERTPTEIAGTAGYSRAAVYRGIHRLRAAFVAGGLDMKH